MHKRSDPQSYRGTDSNGISNSYSDLLNLALLSLGTGAAVGTGVGGVKLLRDYFKSRDQLPEVYEAKEQDLLNSVGNAAHSAVGATSAAVRPLLGLKASTDKQAAFEELKDLTAATAQDFGVGAGLGALTIPAAILPAIGGFYGANYLVDLYRKKKLDQDVDAAKQEFQDALKFENAAPKLAADASDVGAQIDELFYTLKSAEADNAFRIVNQIPDFPTSDEVQNNVASSYKYIPHSPQDDTATDQSSMAGLGWLATLPLGLAATGTFLYAKNKLDADPELKRRKELKQMLRRQKALEAGNTPPTIGDDGLGINLNDGV